MKRRDLIAHLEANGCELVREGAKHSWWGNPENQRRSSVPRHTEISDALHQMLMSGLTVLPVVDEGVMIGMVFRVDLMQALLADAQCHHEPEPDA